METTVAAIEEIAGHVHRLVEQSARIVAQIEHEAVELAARLALHRVDRLHEFLLRLLREGGDADIADMSRLELRFHRGDVDDRARQGDVERLRVVRADGDA